MSTLALQMQPEARLLTATRRNEIVATLWPEIAETGLWPIPSARYKTKKDHVVLLSEAALTVVTELPQVLPDPFSVVDHAPAPWTLGKATIDAGAPNAAGLSWHCLRKIARTLMSRAGVRADHMERALRQVQGVVERAYDQHS